MTNRRYHVILNARAGGAATQGIDKPGLTRLFEDAGLAVTIDDSMDEPLAERIAAALASEADIVVSAGGDGTATAVAAALAGSDKSLAILPLGTANLLARDLRIPLVLAEAVSGLKAMQPRLIDLGEVNGAVFLHKVVIGLIPGIAAAREQLRGRDEVGATFGFLRFFMRRLDRARRFAVEITAAGAPPRIERAQAVAIANNAYDEGVGRFFSRETLDGGRLGLYVIKRFAISDIIKLTTAMALGRWRRNEAITIEAVEAVTIRSRRARLQIMIDGEVESRETPLRFRILPRALSVLAPPAAAAVS